jgi:hypothetical protein
MLALGCALVFASEAKIEIEAKISFRLEAKKSMISLVTDRSEKAKICSKKECEINEKKRTNRSETKMNRKID